MRCTSPVALYPWPHSVTWCLAKAMETEISASYFMGVWLESTLLFKTEYAPTASFTADLEHNTSLLFAPTIIIYYY